MRSRFGMFVLLLVVLVIGFSFYRGYLTLTSQKQPVTDNPEIKLIVDQDKLKADTDAAGAEVQKMTKDVDLKPGS
ncbi:hypothetical protein NA78x_004367 [Anatilimnocola sp. NA78]|uniref:hypothetical protein n=1 Tax=Anatilimnocola sp. NA78 TaxID=3415683 RepID=UPI003CE54EC5